MSDYNTKQCSMCGNVFDRGTGFSERRCPVCNPPDRNKEKWQTDIEKRTEELEAKVIELDHAAGTWMESHRRLEEHTKEIEKESIDRFDKIVQLASEKVELKEQNRDLVEALRFCSGEFKRSDMWDNLVEAGLCFSSQERPRRKGEWGVMSERRYFWDHVKNVDFIEFNPETEVVVSKEMVNAAEMLKVALGELVYLKGLKSIPGHEEEYERRKPKAWEAAMYTLKQYREAKESGE